MSWSREDRMLCYCCSTRYPVPLKWENLDWSVFLNKARSEGVAPLVFEYLSRHDAWHDIEAGARDKLHNDYYLNAARNTVTFVEINRVLHCLNHHGIQVIVMKGAALAEGAYGNVALRPMSDVDLLIRGEDLNRVDDAMKTVGYAPVDRPAHTVDFSLTYLTTLDYRKSGKETLSFHIHWHLVNSTIDNESYARHIDMDLIWHDAVTEPIAGTQTRVMAPHHLIIHLSEHALRVSHSLSKLIYFCDIDRAVNYHGSGLDWDRVVRDAFRFHVNTKVYVTLYFARHFINTAVPDGVLRRLRPLRHGIGELIFMYLTERNRRTAGASYLLHLSAQEGTAKKVKFVGRTFFPPRQILAQRRCMDPSDTTCRQYVDRVREVLSRIGAL